MERLYIFAKTSEQARNYIRDNNLNPLHCTIVKDVSHVQGLDVAPEQIIAIGEWYHNLDVSMAYDCILYRIKMRLKDARHN